MARYDDILDRVSLGLGDIDGVSGGVLEVNPSDVCHKDMGVFEVLGEKNEKWQKAGCPKMCEYCWNLKFDNGFYCDA